METVYIILNWYLWITSPIKREIKKKLLIFMWNFCKMAIFREIKRCNKLKYVAKTCNV